MAVVVVVAAVVVVVGVVVVVVAVVVALVTGFIGLVLVLGLKKGYKPLTVRTVRLRVQG